MRNRTHLVLDAVDSLQGKKISSRRHPSLQLLKILVLGLQKRVTHDYRNGKQTTLDASNLKTARKLLDLVGRMLKIKKRNHNPKHRALGNKTGPRPRMLNSNNRHFGLPKPCNNKKLKRQFLPVRQQVKVRNIGAGK